MTETTRRAPRKRPPTKAQLTRDEASKDADARVAAMAADMEKMSEENAALRTQITAMEITLNQKDTGAGEYEALVKRLKSQRDDVTLKLAQCVDGYRSASIAYHAAKHPGGYSACQQDVCRMASEMWEFIGQAPGLALVLANPENFWLASEDRLLPVFPIPGDSTDEETPVVRKQPSKVEAYTAGEDDLGLDPKYEGKRLRVVRSPAPEKDTDVPEPPTVNV